MSRKTYTWRGEGASYDLGSYGQEAFRRALENMERTQWGDTTKNTPSSALPSLRDSVGALEEERDRLRRENGEQRNTLDIQRRELARLRTQVMELQRHRCPSAAAAPASDSAIAAEIFELVQRWHPDRNQEPLNATEVVAELNRLRDRARGKR